MSRHTVLVSGLYAAVVMAMVCVPATATRGGPPPIGHIPPSEQFVGEALIVDDRGGLTRHVYLPVTIHGRAATLVLDTGAPTGLLISRQWLRQQGDVGTDVLDSLVIGKTLVLNVPIAGGFGVDTIPGMAPMVGLAGNHFLARYDLVFDGPARRVRLYAPGTPPKGTSVAVTAGECPLHGRVAPTRHHAGGVHAAASRWRPSGPVCGAGPAGRWEDYCRRLRPGFQ